jgi:hypothetical protein
MLAKDKTLTVWVGDIPPVMKEEELLVALERVGSVVSSRFLERPRCAFATFEVDDALPTKVNASEVSFADRSFSLSSWKRLA